MTNEFSGEESYPPLRRSLTELLFSAVLFQGRHWGLKASTSLCSMPSYPHCGLLLLLNAKEELLSWLSPCLSLTQNLCASVEKADCTSFSEPHKAIFPFCLFPHWHVPGLAQSGNLIEASLLGFSRASPSVSLLVLLHCWLPASRWRCVCCGACTACLCLLLCMRKHFSFSELLPFPASSRSPSFLHPCHSLKLSDDWWFFSELYSGKRNLLLLDCCGEGLPYITVSPCMFCVLCSNIATGAPVCAPSKGFPKPQRNCCMRKR